MDNNNSYGQLLLAQVLSEEELLKNMKSQISQNALIFLQNSFGSIASRRISYDQIKLPKKLDPMRHLVFIILAGSRAAESQITSPPPLILFTFPFLKKEQ